MTNNSSIDISLIKEEYSAFDYFTASYLINKAMYEFLKKDISTTTAAAIVAYDIYDNDLIPIIQELLESIIKKGDFIAEITLNEKNQLILIFSSLLKNLLFNSGRQHDFKIMMEKFNYNSINDYRKKENFIRKWIRFQSLIISLMILILLHDELYETIKKPQNVTKKYLKRKGEEMVLCLLSHWKGRVFNREMKIKHSIISSEVFFSIFMRYPSKNLVFKSKSSFNISKLLEINNNTKKILELSNDDDYDENISFNISTLSFPFHMIHDNHDDNDDDDAVDATAAGAGDDDHIKNDSFHSFIDMSFSSKQSQFIEENPLYDDSRRNSLEEMFSSI